MSKESELALRNLVIKKRAADAAVEAVVAAQQEQGAAIEHYIRAVSEDAGDGEPDDGGGDGGDGGEEEPPPPTEVWECAQEGDVYLFGRLDEELSRTLRNPALMVFGANRWSSSSKNTPRLCKPGAEIRVGPGDYPHGRLTQTYDESGIDQTIVIRGAGADRTRFLPNPVGGSQTWYAEWAGGVDHHGITFVGDDLAAVMTENPFSTRWNGTHPGFRDIRFFDCDIDGGYNHRTATGPKNKWGLLGYAAGPSAYGRPGFVWIGGRLRGIYKEHAFYWHNIQGDHLYEHLDLDGFGRTLWQFVSRSGEGELGGWPDGKGDVVIRRCSGRRFGLEQGGGGYGITLKGRHRGKFLIDRCNLDAGGYELHPNFQANIVGCMSTHVSSGDRDLPKEVAQTDAVEVRGCYFSMGQMYQGSGSARRACMDIASVGTFTMTGTTIQTFPGSREALRIDPETVTHLELDDTNKVLGDCYYGQRRFHDPEYTGAGYTAMLDALNAEGLLS